VGGYSPRRNAATIGALAVGYYDEFLRVRAFVLMNASERRIGKAYSCASTRSLQRHAAGSS